MIGKRCGTCEFYFWEEHMACTIPRFMPAKNQLDLNDRIPTDCPLRNKTREEAKKEILAIK